MPAMTVNWGDLLRAKLAAVTDDEAWRVVDQSTQGNIALRLEHPLTSAMSVGFDDDGEDRQEYIDQLIQNREFGLIRRRPREIPNAPLMQAIRVAAQTYRWDPETVSVLARILAASGTLTDEEADWLFKAGPAWFREA